MWWFFFPIILFIHYRKPVVRRVPTALPCAQTRAHGKPDLCRVPEDRAHSKLLAHGKNFLCRVPEQKTHGKTSAHGKEALFGICLTFDTQQKIYTRQKNTICRMPNFLNTAKLLYMAIFFKKN